MTLQQDQQAIQQAEAALAALGPLTSATFDQAFQLLVQRKNAQDDIKKYQTNQFYPDAFNLVSQAQNAGQGDKVVTISQFLRQFAEYVATQTQSLEPTHSTVKSIVDAIPPMTGSNG